MSGPPATPEPPAPGPVEEPRQRWRMVVARSAGAAGATHRDVAEAWLGALVAAGLPLARTEGRAKSPIAFGAALPVGMAAERELVDIVLTERWPAWRVREALEGRLPDGWRLVELSDVWLAGPPLGGRVVAADYRLELAGEVDASALERAAGELLAADRLPRERAKGGGVVAYDLRPLLVDVKVQPGSPVIVLTRTRFHPELGTGRPEEVLAALGDRLGTALEARAIVRERILTADDIV